MYIPFLDRAFVRIWDKWIRRGITDVPRPEVEDLRPTLRHTAQYKWSLVFFFLLVTSLCTASWLRPEKFADMNGWLFQAVRLTLLAAVFVGVLELAGAFRHRVEVAEAHLVITPAIGRSEVLQLPDISFVIEQHARDRIIVVNRNRKKYIISSQLNGFRSLEQQIRSVLPSDRWLTA